MVIRPVRAAALFVGVLLALTQAAGSARGGEPAPGEATGPWELLADPKISRREVIERCREAEDSGFLDLALLERMVAEDEAHEAPELPLEDLPRAERLAELIWRLRDETGSLLGTNGWGSVLSHPALGTPPTTSDLIAAFGHEAVPLLLERLEDPRYTRVVNWGRSARHPAFVPIGAAAAEILARIADRPFASTDVCRLWWREVSEKGEFLATADEMDRSAGPTMYYAIYLAARLVRINPVAAAPLAVRACGRQADILVRKGLVDLLATIEGEGVKPFLRSEAASGPTLLHRLVAASALRDPSESGPNPMWVRDWQALTDHGQPFPSTHEQWCLDGGIASLAVLLASSGAEGVRVLRDGLERRPPRTRGLVAQVLGGADVSYHLYGYIGKVWVKSDPVAPAPEAEMALKALLGDLERIDANYVPRLLDVRVADLAAQSLATRFPERYAFKLSAPAAERDAAIAKMGR
ncbi:MAG: hypothetical protein O2894_09880 [Planctomycetota bacterium]|nr:hypothetical protein [Planctomycetota bacterium]